jgi:large subunit ribosomal protein L21
VPAAPQDAITRDPGKYLGRTMTFAVIKTGGKQYKVAANDVIKIEKLEASAGDVVTFDQVLMVGEGDNVTVGAPLVEGALVAGNFIATEKERTVIILNKHRRLNFDRRNGHRQLYSTVRITEILTGGAKPTTQVDEIAAKRAAARAEAAAAQSVTGKTAAAPKAAAAVKKPAAKKAAAPKADDAATEAAPAAETKPKKAPAKPKAEKAAAEPKAEKTTKAKAEKPAAEKKPAAKKAAPKADKE